MCDLCKNCQPRTYSHSRSKQHLKLLQALMNERKKNGYYIN